MTFADFVEGRLVPIFDAGIIPLLYGLAFLFFLVGIARYFFLENESKRDEGRTFAIWSIIAMAVLFSVWGLVRLLLTALIR